MGEGIKLWRGPKKTKDFYFQDRLIEEYIRRSGTVFNLHKYIGPYRQDTKDASLMYPQNPEEINELTIQDVLLGENRDRKYSDDIIELVGTYNLQDFNFDLSQFGAFMSGDTLVVEFHTNDHIKKVGRKLMNGDVLEVVHLRDDTSLDSQSDIIKKFYVVKDPVRSASGYGPTWHSHIWRVTCSPIVDSQEYRDILHNNVNRDLNDDEIDWLSDYSLKGESDTGVKDYGRPEIEQNRNDQSTLNIEIRQTDLLHDYYKQQVEKRSFHVRHLYFKDGDELAKTGLIKWILNGEGFPDNFSGITIASGSGGFPENPAEGDLFIRTDYVPERLFQRVGPVWRKKQDIWRKDWVPAHRILESFINNEKQTVIGIREDQTFPERQALSQVITPKTKKDKSIS